MGGAGGRHYGIGGIMFDIYFFIDVIGVAGRHALFSSADKCRGCTTFARALSRHYIIWMTDDGDTTCDTLVLWCFTSKYVFIGERHNKKRQHLDQGGSRGIEWFQTRRILVWIQFIPHTSQVSIYHSKVWGILTLYGR